VRPKRTEMNQTPELAPAAVPSLTCRAVQSAGCSVSSRPTGGSGAAAVLLAAAVLGAALVHGGGSRLDAGVRGVVGLLPLGHLHHAVGLAHCRENPEASV